MCEQINNAGMNKGFRPLVEFSDEEISEVLCTPRNLMQYVFYPPIIKGMKQENAVIILDNICRAHTWIFSHTRSVGLFVKEIWKFGKFS